MEVRVSPTPNLEETKFNGVDVKARIWTGVTDSGLEVEMLVLVIMPVDQNPEASARLERELPDYMVPARTLNSIGRYPKAES
jgi:hypothetical protein